MRFERFIAMRLAGSGAKGFTRVIIRLAIGATAVSLAVMIISTAMITGFKKEISEKIFGFWGHIHISDTRAYSSYEAVPFERDSLLEDQIRGIGKISTSYTAGSRTIHLETEGGVTHLHKFAQIPGIIRTEETMEGVILKGVANDFDWEAMSGFIKEGEPLAWDPETPSDGILVSRVTADRLKLELGDSFVIHFVRDGNQLQRRFRVQGIYQTGIEDSDLKYAFIDIRKVRQLLGWEDNQIAGYEVYLDRVDDAKSISDYIYIEYLPANLYAETIRQKFPAIFEWLELQNINEVVILALTLVVAMINMITVMLILILERAPMIAILKSLGAASKRIRRIFLWNAGVILSRGLVLGNLIGILLCAIQRYFKPITLNEADYYIAYAPVHLNPLHVIAINLGTAGVIMVALILPSMLILRLQPVRILRFK